MTVDLRLYLVTDPGYDDLERLAVAGLTGGVTCLQVRDKTGDVVSRVRTVRRFRDALPASVSVVVNDDLAVGASCDGLHVGVDDVAPSVARAVLGPHAVIGWSINDLAQLDDEVEMAACTYVAASPVWATPTKTDTTAPFGLGGVRAIAERLAGRVPLVAIGGIDASNAADVIAAGADGVAVVSAILAAPDPRHAAQQLRAIVDAALLQRGVRA